MKLKPLALVVALLAIAAGFVYWRDHRTVVDPAADPRVGQPLVAIDTIQALRRLRVVANGQTAVIAAEQDGRNWTVPDYFGLPADFAKLSGLVDSLRDAKIGRFVTALPEKLERLGFGGDRIELLGAGDKPLLTIHLGKNNTSGGRFVRLGDEQKAYLVDLNAWLDAVPKNWARSQLLEAKPADVAAVEFRFADGSAFTATRDAKTAEWTVAGLPAGQELKPTAIDDVVSQLTSLHFTETAEPAAPDVVAAREHLGHTVVLTLKDGTSYTVALGRRPAPPPAAKPATETQPAAVTPQAETAETPAAPATPATAPEAEPPAPSPEETQGPAYVFITANRDTDPINALMQQRAFEINDWLMNNLPSDRSALVQDKPTPPAPTTAAPAESPAADEPAAAPQS